MRIVTARKIDMEDDCKHKELHKIKIPEFAEKGFYRTTNSLNAFFLSGKKRNMNKHILYFLDELGISRIKDEYEIKRDSELPVINHDNLYDFFEYIGYDRKKKKICLKD